VPKPEVGDDLLASTEPLDGNPISASTRSELAHTSNVRRHSQHSIRIIARAAALVATSRRSLYAAALIVTDPFGGPPSRIITPLLALSLGARLGVYEGTAQIGEGGMGQVYRATDTKLKRQVAIKILPPSVAADQIG
jgi:hypothetical protein